MSNSESCSAEPALKDLEERLRALEERLRSEMRARGFDPAQDQNLALTGPLAKLYIEREKLKDELARLTGDSTDE